MTDNETSTPRRDFLAKAAAAAASIAGASAFATPLAAAVTSPDATRTSPSPEFDDTWTQRVTAAKHRVVFDSPGIGDGLALTHALIYMQDFGTMFGTTGGAAVPVVVLRHMGTAIALGDALWAKYELGKRYKLKDPATGDEAQRNPFAQINKGDKYALIEPDAALPSLAARGVVFLVCNRALMFFAAELANQRKLDLEATKAELRAGLVPGAILQPSGIYATTRAQEVGCGFLKST